jgi:hypothetical protein
MPPPGNGRLSPRKNSPSDSCYPDFRMLRRPPTTLRIEVRIPPQEVELRLRSGMGAVRNLLLSPTWGMRDPFVGWVGQGKLGMRARHGTSNGLTRLLRGSYVATPSGSRIDGEFRSLLWVVLILRAVWLAILVPLALLAWDSFRYPSPNREALGPEALAPLLILGFLLAVEIFGRRMGDRDEHDMRKHLKRLFRDVATEPAS